MAKLIALNHDHISFTRRLCPKVTFGNSLPVISHRLSCFGATPLVLLPIMLRLSHICITDDYCNPDHHGATAKHISQTVNR